jgi:hypothetical protein
VLTRNPKILFRLILNQYLWNSGIGVSGTAADAWQGGLKKEVAYSLLPNDSARITDRSIKYKSLYYTCPPFIRENMGSDARINSTWKVQIKHDPRQTKKILLCHNNMRFAPEWNHIVKIGLKRISNIKINGKGGSSSNQNSNLRNEVAFQSKV